MKCEAGLPIGKINGAAWGETVFAQRPLHGKIVPVGVDAQIRTLLQRPMEAVAGNAGIPPGNGYAMDHSVGLVVTPLAALNDCVCGIRAGNIGEYSKDLIRFCAYI